LSCDNPKKNEFTLTLRRNTGKVIIKAQRLPQSYVNSVVLPSDSIPARLQKLKNNLEQRLKINGAFLKKGEA